MERAGLGSEDVLELAVNNATEGNARFGWTFEANALFGRSTG